MKKIIAIVAVIAIMTAILCIGTNAYTNGDIIESGTIIKFTDHISNSNALGITGIDFNCNNVNYNKIQVGALRVDYESANSNTLIAYYDGEWQNSVYRIIKLNSDFTIYSTTVATFFTNNVEEVIKPPLENTINNTKATFTTTLTVATAIIAWLMANQIALVGLYMYILIALVATGKRFITGA